MNRHLAQPALLRKIKDFLGKFLESTAVDSGRGGEATLVSR